MLCIIKVDDGVTVNHPIVLDNFYALFPDADLDDLPEGYELFERRLKPPIGDHEVFVSPDPIYEKRDGVWTDVWVVRDKTDQDREEEAKQDLRQLIRLSNFYLESADDQDNIAVTNRYISRLTAVLEAVPFVIQDVPQPWLNTETRKLVDDLPPPIPG